MPETQSSLLRRVKDPADAESWREFAALYEPLLLSYACSRGVGEADARDVAQDVFARLVRELPDFKLDHARGRFRTWLWKLTMNAIADRGRQRGRQAEAEARWQEAREAEHDKEGGEPDRAWLAAHRQRVLEFAIERVRADTQVKTWACFEGHVLKRRPSAQVGLELGLTANSVCVNASRVLDRVRQQCDDYDEVVPDGPGE